MLVDYGSDSDSEPAAPAPAPAPSTSTSGLALPPPKNTNTKKRAKILLDLPPPSAQPHEPPPAKKLKLSSGNGKTGLNALLPAPKKSSVMAKPTPKTATPATPATGDLEQEIPLMVPTKVQKSVQPSEPSTDLFGISAASTNASLPSLTSSSSTLGISSAPVVAEKEKANYYSTLPPPTPDDPYPGFHCLPSGQWAPNEPEEWAKFTGGTTVETPADQLDAAAPKGFESIKFGEVVSASQETSKADRNAAAIPIPSKIVETPLSMEDEEARLDQLRESRARARGKNQLSSLLADSVLRRQELEERIAIARANRKSGGARYGF